MARREKTRGKKSRAAKTKKKGAVKRTARKISTRSHPAARAKKAAPVAATAAPKAPKPPTSGSRRTAGAPRRQADVPMEILSRTYTPKQTSLKASFRASGEERERDQDLVAVERWSDEDH